MERATVADGWLILELWAVVNLKDELELKIVVRSERGARILSAMMRAYEGPATVCVEGVLRVEGGRAG